MWWREQKGAKNCAIALSSDEMEVLGFFNVYTLYGVYNKIIVFWLLLNKNIHLFIHPKPHQTNRTIIVCHFVFIFVTSLLFCSMDGPPVTGLASYKETSSMSKHTSSSTHLRHAHRAKKLYLFININLRYSWNNYLPHFMYVFVKCLPAN